MMSDSAIELGGPSLSLVPCGVSRLHTGCSSSTFVRSAVRCRLDESARCSGNVALSLSMLPGLDTFVRCCNSTASLECCACCCGAADGALDVLPLCSSASICSQHCTVSESL